MLLKNQYFAHIAILAIMFTLVGCAGAGDNPAVPSITDLPGLTSQGDFTIPGEAGVDGLRGLWSLYEVNVNTETGVVDIVPLRSQEATWNVTMFLQPPAGNPANLGITIIDASNFLTGGLIDLDVSITHPFAAKPQLRGFDVMGVFMATGSQFGFMDPSLYYAATGSGLYNGHIINADGYTRWMNAGEFIGEGVLGFTYGSKGIPGFAPTATLNGFKYFAENLGATDDIQTFYQTPINVTARGSFKAGSTLSRRYELKFPAPGGSVSVYFQYAIVASWWKPDPASLPNPAVDDFPTTANLQEPFHIAITDNGSDLFYVDPSDLGGTLRLQVEVFDWQGAANPAGVPGELASLWIEDANGSVIPSPGYYDMLTFPTITAGTGCSSVFTVDIPNCTPTGVGRQEFLVTAESADPTTYDQGFGTSYPPLAALSAFTRFSSTVSATNPCPTPDVTGVNQQIFNVGDIVPQFGIVGTNFLTGPQLALDLRSQIYGFIMGQSPTVLTATTAEAMFDFTGATAGTYDLWFVNGCGTPAPVQPSNQVELNRPPVSSGISGPIQGDGTLGVVQYLANASDPDTDPIDTLTYTWDVTNMDTSDHLFGPVTGDPYSLDFGAISVANSIDIQCVVSDGYPPADLTLNYAITRLNTQPTIGTPNGAPTAWYNFSTELYNVVANDIDPGQTLTYMWSLVPTGIPASYTIPGDPTPGNLTVNFKAILPGPGLYDLSCEVDDGSGAGNALNQSPITTILVADDPYTTVVPPAQFSQVVSAGIPSLQGVAWCPSFNDSFYAALGTVSLHHPDISILSGPSLGTPGVMVIADEMGALTGTPAPPMGFAHFTCPFTTGTPPSWFWFGGGLFNTVPPPPSGPDMMPSVVHFDGNSAGEMFITNSQLTNKLIAAGVPDPSAIQHYTVGGTWNNDLYTTLPAATLYDVGADVTSGFDEGTPIAPEIPELYGLYTQDASGILISCFGPAPGLIAPNPVHILQFPGTGVQPAATPVDSPGSVGVVAPIPVAMVGPGVGMFNNGPGGPCPTGAMIYPEPYYALAIDDEPSDNLFASALPQPIGWWVVAATIDGDRDVEIYEIDFGVAPPGPAPIMLLSTIPMGSFLGGNPTAYPMDCEFIPNYSGYGGTPKPIWNEDLLAVLVAETTGGTFQVEIYTLAGGVATFLSISQPIPVPPTIYGVPGVAYRLDVDEVTGDIYVVHDDAFGSASMAVTIFNY